MAENMHPRFMLDAALKAQQWEIAKGHLRALVALQGSHASGLAFPDIIVSWEELDAKVDAFIKDIEGEALHE